MTSPDWTALKAHIASHPVEGSPVQMRRAFVALAPDPVAGCEMEIGSVPCVRFGASGGNPIVWLHGGGLIFGSADTHGALAKALAHRTGRDVLIPNYRLAPEHPWPAPLDDCLAVIDALDGAHDLVGDSAGGFLAVHCSLRRPDRIARLALISPNTDHWGRSTTRVANSTRDAMNDDTQDRALAKLSFGDRLIEHPDASFLHRDLSALPPVWITAASNEVLLDDTLLFVAAIARDGVPCRARIHDGLCHLWMLWPDALPESRAVVDDLSGWLRDPAAPAD